MKSACQSTAREFYLKLPSVGVIIPTRNRAGMIGRAVASVVKQEYPDLTVVIVDDGSTDRTPQVLQALEATYPQIRSTRIEGPQGPGAARNAGVRHCNGTLLGFLDSDDEWLPGTLLPRVESLVARTDAGAVGVVGKRVYCRAEGSILFETPYTPHLPASLNKFLSARTSMAWPTLLVSRSAFEAIDGFDPTLPCSEWWDLCARLSQIGQLDSMDLAVELHYEHDAARQWTLQRRVRAARMLAQKYKNVSGAGADHAARRLRFAATGSLELGEVEQAMCDLKDSLDHHFNWQALLRLVSLRLTRSNRRCGSTVREETDG